MLNRYTGQNLYPGFESLPHRHNINNINNLRHSVGKAGFPASGPGKYFRSLTFLSVAASPSPECLRTRRCSSHDPNRRELVLRHVFADVLREDVIGECLVTNASYR